MQNTAGDGREAGKERSSLIQGASESEESIVENGEREETFPNAIEKVPLHIQFVLDISPPPHPPLSLLPTNPID